MKKKNIIVKDPVCGMNVDPTASSWSSTRAGEIYFFCSEHCRDKFQSNPELFIHKKKEVLLNPKSIKQNAGSYICPMCSAGIVNLREFEHRTGNSVLST